MQGARDDRDSGHVPVMRWDWEGVVMGGITDRDGAKIVDRNGVEIQDGDFVSLDGNMTADDSMGYLPNGWTFDEDDVYQVYHDDRIGTWSLKLGCEPDTPYNIKYMNHAVALLHSGDVTVVEAPK